MLADVLLSEISSKLNSRLLKIEAQQEYLSFLVKKRYANERLLQLELMNIVAQTEEVSDYLPEKLYDSEGKEKCDLWFKLKDGTEFWVEIKTRPTNYRKPAHAKAITHGVQGIIDDVRRLKRIQGKHIRRIVVFAFYPIYSESYPVLERTHLSRISREIGKNIKNPAFSIKVQDSDFSVYIVTAK